MSPQAKIAIEWIERKYPNIRQIFWDEVIADVIAAYAFYTMRAQDTSIPFERVVDVSNAVYEEVAAHYGIGS